MSREHPWLSDFSAGSRGVPPRNSRAELYDPTVLGLTVVIPSPDAIVAQGQLYLV